MVLRTERLVEYDRLSAPRAHLGVLVEPRAERLEQVLRDPADDRLDGTPLLDTSLGAVRRQLRAELELAGPVIVTGHQPEYFHAGVFAKNIAARRLAERHGGEAVFLTVDSDLPKSQHLVLPQTTPGGLRTVNVDIPGVDRLRPYEAQPSVPREHWLQFFARCAAMYEPYDRSLLRPFAYAWLTEGRAPVYCDALARARAATEQELGLAPLRELRISRLCDTPAFRAFVAHFLLHAPRCVEAYNAAQAAFRARHKVRAAGRPVPRLAADGARLELPFWVLRADGARRRLFVQSGESACALFADEEPLGHMTRDELARSATHEHPWPPMAAPWQLRPRALTLSCFGRLLLADLFIHGIGGAKYDEMMEAFATAVFAVSPAALCCVSATLHLPLPQTDVTRADVIAARHESRDVRCNPQRHLKNLPEALVRRRAELVRRSDELRARDPGNRAERRSVFREIRRVTAQMLERDAWKPAEYDRRADELDRQLALNAIARQREYFYALHSRETLAALIGRMDGALTPGT